MRGSQCVERSELREDRRFIIGGRACVDAGLAVDLLRNRSEGRFGFPVVRIDGLPVIVGVEDDGMFRAWGFDFAVNDRVGARSGELFRVNVPLFECGDECVGVALYVGFVAGNVGDREECREFLQDLLFVCDAVVMGGDDGRLGEKGSREHEREHQ